MHVVAPEEVPDGASEMDSVAERVASLGAPLRQLIDERLAAIAESIRSVEWRSYVARSDGQPRHTPPPPLEPPLPPPPLGPPPRQFPSESPLALVGAPATTSAPLADAPVDDDGEPTTPDRVTTVAPPPTPSASAPTDGASADAAAAPGAVAEGAAITAESTPSGSRTIGHRLLPWFVAVVVVVVGVVVVRLTATTIPGSLTPRVVTPAPAHTVATAPVGSVTRAKYLAASNQMDMANAAATTSFSGTFGDSVTRVDQALGPYVRALQTFVYTVHGLSWPGVTEVSSEQLTQQVQALVTYSSTASSVDAATLHTWLATFRSLAKGVQSADNVVRSEIGIATTASYP
jgi:hypothetical protein